MSRPVTVRIQMQNDVLPALEDSHFVYVHEVDLTPDEKRALSTISVPADGILLTEISKEERRELIKLFRTLALSLENEMTTTMPYGE